MRGVFVRLRSGESSMILQSAVLSKTPRYSWVVLFAVYMATLAAPFNQLKVPPVMPILRESFHLGYSGAGMLMSIFSILGFALAIPAGFILQRIGIKMTGLISVGSVMIGAVLGALSGTTEMLFFGRFIEGAGMGLIMVAAPAAISLWFPAEKRGLPMGLWSTSIGVANIAILNLAPVLAASFGWRSIWWTGAIIAAVAFILFLVLFRLPKQDEISEVPPPVSNHPASDKSLSSTGALWNGSLWLISISFLLFNLVVMALTSFYPDFLNTIRQYSLQDAALMMSLMIVFSLFSASMGGYLSDRLGKRKVLIVAPFILLALIFLFPFTLTGWMIPAIMIAYGTIAGPIAPITLAAVPEIMPSPRLVGIGLGVVILGQNLGMLIGPTMFGMLIEKTSWATAGYLLVPLCVVAIIAAWMAKIR
jgi:MFS family permease